MSDIICLLYITCKDQAEALRLGKLAVERRLAACANILDPMTSIYIWQNATQSAQEVVLILKTLPESVERCVELVKSEHSYDVPCILSWRVKAENSDYFDWIKATLNS